MATGDTPSIKRTNTQLVRPRPQRHRTPDRWRRAGVAVDAVVAPAVGRAAWHHRSAYRPSKAMHARRALAPAAAPSISRAGSSSMIRGKSVPEWETIRSAIFGLI